MELKEFYMELKKLKDDSSAIVFYTAEVCGEAFVL